MQVTTDAELIVDRGRGPEIAGTRITVFDVMDYLKHGWHRGVVSTRIAASAIRRMSRPKSTAVVRPPNVGWPRSVVACRSGNAMPRIMADHNVEGHLQVLLNIWSSPAWGDVWEGMGGDLEFLLDLENLRGTGRLYVP